MSDDSPATNPDPAPERGVRRRFVASCWTAFFVLLGGGTLLLVLFCFLLPAWMLSGWYPEGAYVSDRPDLTYNTEKHEGRRVHDQLDGFLQARGVSPKAAREVRIASGTHYKHGLVFTFQLPPKQRRRLVRGMKRRSQPVRNFTGPASDERGMLGAVVGTSPVIHQAELQYLRTKEPFRKLTWWPPRAAELKGMAVYEGPIDWHQSEISPSTCWIFVSPHRDTVYVAANGAH